MSGGTDVTTALIFRAGLGRVGAWGGGGGGMVVLLCSIRSYGS